MNEIAKRMRYVSLHHHTTYSYLDGYGTPQQHAQRASELGYNAIAFTEHGNVSSHFRAEKACDTFSIKPIFGIEAYTGSTLGMKQQTKWHLTVLAATQRGYQNLNRAVTDSWREFHYHPTLSGQVLKRYSEGLIVLSGCTGSLLACTLIGGKGIPEPERIDMSGAQMVVERFRDMLPSYYLEVQAFPELDNTRKINKALAKLSRWTGVPLAATMDVHYPRPEDSEMQVILHACGPQGRGMATADEMLRRWNYDVKLTLPESDRQMADRLIETGLTRNQAWEAIRNTERIAEQCNVKLPKASRLRFPCPHGMKANDLIWDWLRDGWRHHRLGSRSRTEQDWYLDRLQYEMKLIEDKDFVDFFLATSEVIKWSKANGIAVGPGRGSAAASLVCWLLRITEIDPGRYNGMMFERFMDANRTDPPDIDVDFEDDRRHEVREHLEDMYGQECVGTIANFVRYRGKNALVDVARVHEVPKAAKEVVSNLVIGRSGGDSRFDASLEDTVEMFPNAKAIFDAFPSLWLATRLEGNVRGMSVHAAGLVVANNPLTDICAIYERDGRQVLSIDKYDVGYAGFLKMDFLGLSTMGAIARCLKMTGLTLEDLYAVPDTDEDTLDIFRNNDVTSVFQFEGRATRIVCRDAHPDNFPQVADVNALARPGPLFSGTTADYCDVKHGRKKAERYHPIIDDITAPTFGQIIYQEQILKILQIIGGFDWTDLNAIRNIIAKKAGQAALHANMANFQAGAERLHDIKPEDSARIWKRIVTSGTYAFNIAHAISYSMLAWWCAYLKSHYPAEWYAASLSKAEPGKDTEFALMKDARKHGIGIFPPDLQQSEISWGVMDDFGTPAVLAGFTSVPGIGERMANAIIAERNRAPFLWWEDMTRTRGIGAKKVEAIKQFCAAPDPFGLDRSARILQRVTDALRKGDITAPKPTHDGDAVAAEVAPEWGKWKQGKKIVYMGIVKARIYQDYVENVRSRTGEEVADIIAAMKNPELTKYCVLHCFDAGQEEVYVRINRYAFPRFRRRLESVSVGHDVVIAVGRKTPGFGNSVAIDELYVIDPD